MWGVAAQWNMLVSGAVGISILAAPNVLGSEGPLADSNHVVGALLVCVAVIATAEVSRVVRYLNVAFGGCVAATPFFFCLWSRVGQRLSFGIRLLALSLAQGCIKERYGTADRFVH